MKEKVTDVYRMKEGMLQTEDKYKLITAGLELGGLMELKGSDKNWCIPGGKPLKAKIKQSRSHRSTLFS